MATKARVWSTCTDAVAGVTTSEVGVAAVTVSEAVSVKPLYVAVMVTVPAVRPVAKPRPPPKGPPPPDVMLAMVLLEVVHDAELVTVCEVPSSKVASATNCWVPLTRIDAVVGVTSRPVRAGLRTERLTVAVCP